MKKYTLIAAVILLALLTLKTSFAEDNGHGHDAPPAAAMEQDHEGHDDKNTEEHEDHDAGEEDHDDHGGHESGEADHDDHEKEETGHADHDEGKDGHSGGHDEEDESGAVELNPESIKAAGIVVEAITPKNLEGEINAPGEVKLNSYLSSKVTPRITAQIVARHAKLGEVVKKGQPLVTLSSVELAEAVGELLVAHKEWERVKKLGKSAVSAKRYSEAQIADTQALAKVKAYGMTDAAVKKLHSSSVTKSPGAFQLVAPQEGTIVSDEFIEGELIEPGRVLFDLVNESSLWVESRLSPDLAEGVKAGDAARVHIPGNGWLNGKVVQKHHLLDEETRTIGVRIEVQNEGDRLHPGMFVEAKIQAGQGDKYLAVPTKALLRSADGDWVVFVEQKPGHFKPQEVRVLRAVNDHSVVMGLQSGVRIVTEGAFFVQSELAKSGFAVHNH